MYTLPQRQVHLDFHTSEAFAAVGSKFDKESFQACLRVGHVNSITLFAKCHHGWAYFPSEKNEMHPNLTFDLLSAQIEACREIGVSCPIYISAGLDEKYFRAHPYHMHHPSRSTTVPEIATLPDGTTYTVDEPRYHDLCFNTPYLDVLVAQVEEVVTKFMPEGIFLDICQERPCYCESCRRSVCEHGWDEEDDSSFLRLAKITYRNYYEAINRAAKAIKPDIKVFHNGGHIPVGRRDIAYSNTHLELESLPTGGWGYDHFPKSAKYCSHLGMHFLGMTGKFHFTWGEFGGFKHPNALRYEVALSLALGAKCSIGDQMHPYGFLDPATYELIGTAYAEAEAVEEYCYGIKPIADIAILAVEGITGNRHNKGDVGAARILLEGNFLFDFIDSEMDFTPYKLLLLPEGMSIDPILQEKIRAFVEQGGKILATGSTGADALAFLDLGCRFLGKSEYNPAYLFPAYNATGLTPSRYVIYKSKYDISLTDNNATVLAYAQNPLFNRTAEHFCSHRHTPFTMDEKAPAIVIGKDGGYIAFDILSEYADAGSYSPKEAVIRTLDAILGAGKTLATNLPSTGVVTLNDQPDASRYVLHALFATPTKRGSGSTSVEVIEDLIPLYNTNFTLKLGKKVKSVVLAPQNRPLPFTEENGTVSFTLERFECKQVVVIQY